jgi:hypothetical protein
MLAPMSRLILETECEHGNMDCLTTLYCRDLHRHKGQSYDHADCQTSWQCPGGSRIILDPDRNVAYGITVQDVLDALEADV